MSALSDVLDVVEHLVNTHQSWNEGLSQVQAQAKVAAAKAALVVPEVEAVANDAVTGVQAASDGNVEGVANVVKELVGDVEKLVKEL